MSLVRIGTTLVLLCSLAAAQGAQDMKEKMRKQMEEISRLMRDSERRLLELTKVDRIAAQQSEIVERLGKLIPDPNRSPEQAAQAAKRKQELEKKQGDLQRKLEEMLNGQKKSAEMSVEELKRLLRNLPRQQQQGQGQGDKKKQQRKREREKRLRDQEQKEREQRDPQSARKKREQMQKEQKERRGARKPQSEQDKIARMNRVKAWIARLPPEEQARINRNDFSHIPMRYRRLVREYTALRAKREAEKAEEENR